MTPIPLHPITGFLGAGKTTLLNRLLRNGFDGERVALVVNDFGKLNIDAILLEQEADDMLTLADGCVCCTLATNLMQGIASLADSGKYDRILIETSGLTRFTDLKTTLTVKELQARVTLGTTVCVVDARRFLKHHESLPILKEQAQGADVLLLNRADDVSPATLTATQELLASLCPEAQLITTTRCAVSREDLGFNASHRSPPGPGIPTGAWKAYELTLHTPVDPGTLLEDLQNLPETVFRVKGFASAEDGTCLEVHAVSGSASVTPWTAPLPANANNTLVVIGSNLLNEEDILARTSFSGASCSGHNTAHEHKHLNSEEEGHGHAH